ncbi:unnamed protein product, partial [Ectocarpus sp. 13 AM-2016]
QAAAAAARRGPNDENRGAVTGASASRRGGRRLGQRPSADTGGGGGGRGSRGGRGVNSNASAARLGFAVFVEEEFTAGPEAAAAAARARRAAGGGILDDSFQDDGGGRSSSSSAAWADYGTRASRQKENTANPSRWTDGALGDRPGAAAPATTRPGERVRAAAPFPIYIDEQFVEKEEHATSAATAPHNPGPSAKRPPPGGGLSVRRQLDPKVGGSGGSAASAAVGGLGRKELLAKDPLFFVK